MPQTKDNERVMRGVSNSNLPPSIEGAYYKKSIEIKRRIDEIEHNNDKRRSNLERVNRDVQKLRLERALLIDMVKRGVAGKSALSDKSDSPPPTPQEKPTRLKRKTKGGTPPTDGPSALMTSPAASGLAAGQQSTTPKEAYVNSTEDLNALEEDVPMEDTPAESYSAGFTAVNQNAA
ncbi:hypothetical protein BT63DRAFT_419343 [Microthyrium microscopicum]|uniref:INO80 complex subunit F domain-containing protein n=1 Tax=Microthyrium microscopicum TaxID=703497 RepID=A0A6A6UP15_9PEZI|nr:hypothetical protein BT63DRAFT_419343 [Microthyrium microscopicum]